MRWTKILVPLKSKDEQKHTSKLKEANQDLQEQNSQGERSSFNSLIGSLEIDLATENNLYYAVAEQIGL